ncbi:SGNH/GDSL hydrolase family protein [candidate division KSB1 bacterium]|nr:SGNH/GDSL hydrolase family protein [candidate division KSB1 bacterium]
MLRLSLSLFILACQPQQNAPDILNGRIIFLGDSITQDGRYVSIIEYELFKHYPEADVDLISIGLSSETVSGLTEPEHPYPRPNVHDRLGRMLQKLKPQTVFACYGMNDGIYHPQSDDRFQAYKDGIQKLIADVKAAGAHVILLTPPLFDPTAIPEKVVSLEAKQFGYPTPYADYNDVLAEYAVWLASLDMAGVRVYDLNGPMLDYLHNQRETNPDFTLSSDGVHPGWTGHALMAQLVLKGLAVPVEEMDAQDYAEQLQQDELFKMVHDRRRMRSMAWLLDIGFEKPGEYEGLPVEEAEAKAQTEKEKILAKVRKE